MEGILILLVVILAIVYIVAPSYRQQSTGRKSKGRSKKAKSTPASYTGGGLPPYARPTYPRLFSPGTPSPLDTPKLTGSVGEHWGYPTEQRVRELCAPYTNAADRVISEFSLGESTIPLTGQTRYVGTLSLGSPNVVYGRIAELTGKPLEVVLYENMKANLKKE